MQLPTAAASSKWPTLPIWLKLCLLNSATGTVLRRACFTGTGHRAEHSFQVLAALGDILNGTDEISLSRLTSSPVGCRGQRCCSLSAPTQQTTLPGKSSGDRLSQQQQLKVASWLFSNSRDVCSALEGTSGKRLFVVTMKLLIML